jgi:hypothetical protein
MFRFGLLSQCQLLQSKQQQTRCDLMRKIMKIRDWNQWCNSNLAKLTLGKSSCESTLFQWFDECQCLICLPDQLNWLSFIVFAIFLLPYLHVRFMWWRGMIPLVLWSKTKANIKQVWSQKPVSETILLLGLLLVSVAVTRETCKKHSEKHVLLGSMFLVSRGL